MFQQNVHDDLAVAVDQPLLAQKRAVDEAVSANKLIKSESWEDLFKIKTEFHFDDGFENIFSNL